MTLKLFGLRRKKADAQQRPPPQTTDKPQGIEAHRVEQQRHTKSRAVEALGQQTGIDDAPRIPAGKLVPGRHSPQRAFLVIDLENAHQCRIKCHR